MKKILWVKVWGIAIMQGAITLTWVIYNLYFVKLLTQFGFSKELGVSLLIIENILAAFIEPIFGALSDRQVKFLGTRIPLIGIGVLFASLFFMIIPTIAIFGNEQSIWRWLLLLAIVVWTAIMATFHAPMIALLTKCSPVDKLPQANSLVTLFQSVIGSFRFDAYGVILTLGAGFTFTIGSLVLITAGIFLRWLNPPQLLPSESILDGTVGSRSERNFSLILRLKLTLVFVMGMAMGWTLRFLLPAIAKILEEQWGQTNLKFAITLFLITLGISSLPAGKVATKISNYLSILLGCGITVITIVTLNQITNQQLHFALILFLICGFSLALNGVIPFVLGTITNNHSALGIGMYFGGFSAGLSLFDFIFAPLANPSQNTGVMGTTFSLMLVITCLTINKKLD